MALTGIPDLLGWQGFAREKARSNTPLVTEYETRADLLNYQRTHALPAKLEDMEEGALYAVDEMADKWDQFPEVHACLMVSAIMVGWIGQLIEHQAEFAWALHGDSKHKLHHGR